MNSVEDKKFDMYEFTNLLNSVETINWFSCYIVF